MKNLNNLLPNTQKVLKQLSELPEIQDFTFVGGSALALYLAHRLSEDIDLFTWYKILDISKLQSALQSKTFETVRIVNVSPEQADFVIDGVKVTFFANGWDELKNRTNIANYLYIATLDTLATMKVNTLFLRAKYRDYYDLYMLNVHHFSLLQLFEMANKQMKNLNKTLFQRALVFVEDIADENIAHLKPNVAVSLNAISLHFQKQIKQWNKNK